MNLQASLSINSSINGSIIAFLKAHKVLNLKTVPNNTKIWQWKSSTEFQLNKTQLDCEQVVPQPFQCGNRIYAYANRLDPGQPPSNSAAALRSNLFAT